MHSAYTRTIFAAAAAFLLLAAACGGDDSQDTDPGGEPNPSSTADTKLPGERSIVDLPMEGPKRPAYVGEPADFRDDPDYKLPSPESLPTPGEDVPDAVLNPLTPSTCTEEAEVLERPTEGFRLCYPSDWQLASHGYLNSAFEPRWYYAGLFKFPGDAQEHQLAHVSIYVLPEGVRPLPYTIDCPQPYSVTFAGEPAVVCPDFPPLDPEARIVSYHVFREGLDYFVNIATYFEYDESADQYTDKTDEAAFETALEIVGSFQFTPVARLSDAETPASGAGPLSP